MIGPGIAALTGLYLLTMPLGPRAWGSLQMNLHLSGQTILLTVLVTYVVGAAVGGALGVGLGGRFLTTVGLTAIALLTAGVLLDALAPGVGLFGAGRVLSGLGAGGVAGATVVFARRAGRHRSAVVAVLAGLGVLSLILGPLVNEVLTTMLTWRMGYLVTVLPLGAALIAAAVSGFVLLLTRRPAPVPPSAPGAPHSPAGQRPWNAPPGA
ncbi:hypothetical protein GCM10022224_023560 [Nonomuraea antimicrobica]|uniref:Major facilitator superfamily (MFS) profile domain-containing protein n=1 Tax=Nonomuraea antimicrobica TaxID=561173 RepID=A0ABP7BFS9_9ACTN